MYSGFVVVAISSSFDAVHKIWDLQRNKLLATLYLFTENQGYVIMVVDDNEINCEIASEVLASQGFNIEIASLLSGSSVDA